MKTRHSIIAFVFMCLVCSPLYAAAADMPGEPAPSAGDIDLHYSVGYFMPHEGDLDGGALAGLGLEYNKNNESVFLEYLFSSTSQNGSVWINDVEHRIVQAAYLAPFKNQDKLCLGAGIQVHQMKFTGIGVKTTRTSLLGLAEYDLSKRWAARLQATLKEERNGLDFGGVALIFVYRP